MRLFSALKARKDSRSTDAARIDTDRPDKDIRMQLLTMVLLAALPLFADMPVAIISVILALSVWQYLLIRTGNSNPRRLMLMIIVATGCTIVYFSYGHFLGQKPGIAMVIIMCVLKLFETRDKRDAYVVLYSATFIIASNFFYGQSVWLALYVCALIIFMVSIMIALSDRLRSTSHTMRIRQSGLMFVYAIPVMLILFVLFPRIPGPLWGLPEDALQNRTGLSEEMSPGSINQLISSSAIAFRVKFDDDRVPPHHQRYWRGIVLSTYDGRTWRRDDAPQEAQANISYAQAEDSTGYSYDVTLEPTNLNWLLALEYPRDFDRRYRLSREATLYQKDTINKVTAYRITSSAGSNQSLFEQESIKYRSLPAGRNPATADLAKVLIEESGYRAHSYISAVLGYFVEQEFVYTLSPDLLGENAMDDFLLQTRRGFCEHYASAFVYLMRLAGIPSRVVVGYQGGVMNPLGDYMIIRQSDAHAWAEVWLDGRWQRVDPTATVSPDRIERGISSAGVEASQLPALLVTDSNLLKNIAYLYDSFQNQWNQWVIGFDEDRQNRLMQMLGFDDASTSLLVSMLTALLACVSLIITWMLFNTRRRSADPVEEYYRRLCNKLERAGFGRQLHEGPRDFEARILAADGAGAEQLSDDKRRELTFIFTAYRKLHYGKFASEKLLSDYKRRIQRLSLKRSRPGMPGQTTSAQVRVDKFPDK